MASRASRVLLVPLAAALVAACQPAASGTATQSSTGPSASAGGISPAYPLTLTDDAGNEVTLAADPQRIVSLAPSNTEIVCAVGACDELVGVTDFDDHPPQIAEVEDVVVGAQVDVEKVVAAEPDLVLAAGNEITPSAVIEQLDQLGLVVMVLYPESLDEIYADITLLGTVLEASAEADALVADMEERVEVVVDAVEGTDAPRTLYEVYHGEGTTYTAGEGSFLASLIEIAGGAPITGDAQGLIAAEDLVAADPELILVGTASYDPSMADEDAALAAVAARAGWGDLTAVRDGRVVPYVDDIVTTRPGPRIVAGLEALARAIHPDRFE